MTDEVGRLPHRALRLLGVVVLVLAGLGLWYNKATLFTRFPSDPGEEPCFLHAFYSISAVCIACYVTLLFVGVQFIRLKTSWLKPFVGVIVFEVLSFFGVALFGLGSDLGRSVRRASVLASGGMMFQFIILFPIWGPLMARWAAKGVDARGANNESAFPQEQIAQLGDWVWAAVHFLVMFALSSVLLGVLEFCLEPVTFSLGSTAGIVALLSTANALLSVSQRRRRRRKAIQRRRDARLARGLCPRCEYDLTGNVSGVCPECGAEI